MPASLLSFQYLHYCRIKAVYRPFGLIAQLLQDLEAVTLATAIARAILASTVPSRLAIDALVFTERK